MEAVKRDASWEFQATLRCDDVATLGILLTNALAGVELPLACAQSPDLLEHKTAIAPRPLADLTAELSTVLHDEGGGLTVAFYYDAPRGWYRIHQARDGTWWFSICVYVLDWIALGMKLDGFVTIARALVAQGVVESLALKREGDETYTTPTLPIASAPNIPGWDRMIVVTTRAEVAEAYERPDDFFAAGWTVEWFGEQALLTRCLHAVTRADLLREIRDHAWAMARAAKPGRTRYVWPRGTEAELPIYEAGEANVRYVGTNADGLTEYACTLRPGQHLHGWEIFELAYAVHRKQLRDGTPTNSIRVVFLDEWMAQAEKRPLLDKGVRVFYMDTDGEDVELTA